MTELKMEILSTELLFQKQNPLVEAAILNTSTVQRFITDLRPWNRSYSKKYLNDVVTDKKNKNLVMWITSQSPWKHLKCLIWIDTTTEKQRNH